MKPAMMKDEKTETHYVSNKADIPEEMKSLPDWFTGLHTDYDLSAWCFYGYVGSGSNLLGISLMLQYKTDSDNIGLYWAAFGVYRPRPSAKWLLAGSINFSPFTIDEPSDEAPWSACGSVAFPGPGRVRIALTKGAFGQPGAVYRLTADVCSRDDIFSPTKCPNSPDLFVDITICDLIGAVPVGYGPASFLPNWLTDQEQSDIDGTYGSSTQAYLSAQKPKMTNQGSYYYSSPVLEVENYTVIEWEGGEPKIQKETNKCGFLWMDSVIQTFGKLLTLKPPATVSWYWFAIPQLTKSQSLAVTSLWYENAPNMNAFKSASLYTNEATSSDPNPNILTRFWNMNEIQITCVTAVKEYNLKLLGGTDNIDLTLTALEGDQTLGPAIEGLFKVTGTIGSKKIGDDCFAWGEISLQAKQTRIASKGAILTALVEALEKSKQH